MLKKRCIIFALLIAFLILFYDGWFLLEEHLFNPALAMTAFAIGLIGLVTTIIMFFGSFSKKDN